MKKTIIAFVFIAGLLASTVYAENPRERTTLKDIYAKLTGNPRANLSFDHPLKQIYDAIPTIDASKVLVGTTYLGIAGTATTESSGKLLKTGQVLCYDDSGNYDTTTGEAPLIPCTGTGQDGDIQAGKPFSYTDNGNGTISDNVTGLTWQKDSTTYATFASALNACKTNNANLPGTGWRLPNIREIESLIDYSVGYPSINNTYFPNTADDYYWSSTTYKLAGHDEGQAWVIDFTDGSQLKLLKSMGNFYRCVRG